MSDLANAVLDLCDAVDLRLDANEVPVFEFFSLCCWRLETRAGEVFFVGESTGSDEWCEIVVPALWAVGDDPGDERAARACLAHALQHRGEI
jgi:hypothetical protein